MHTFGFHMLLQLLLLTDAAYALSPIKWTLHTHPTSWHSASETCKSQGGYLAAPAEPFEKAALLFFISREPWKSYAENGSLVGLFPPDSPSSNYVWTDCPFTAATGIQPVLTDGHCGNVIFPTSDLDVVEDTCDDKARAFICQNSDTSENCQYVHYKGKMSGTTHTTIWPTNWEAECQGECDNRGTDCWAYTYDTPDVCFLFSPEDPMFYNVDANLITVENTNQSVSVKTCFSSEISTTPLEDVSSLSPTPVAVSTDCSHAAVDTALVFTLFTSSATWAEAAQACASINQRLAVLDTQTKADVSEFWLKDAR